MSGLEVDAIRQAEQMLESQEEKALSVIYSCCKNISRKIIMRHIKAKGFALTNEQAEEKAHNAAARIVERYKRIKDFRLKKPVSYVYLCTLEELYHRRKVDDIVDFVPMEDL